MGDERPGLELAGNAQALAIARDDSEGPCMSRMKDWLCPWMHEGRQHVSFAMELETAGNVGGDVPFAHAVTAHRQP